MKKFKQEFIEFVSKGNVLDLAVGVIIGGAFGKIITSLVDNVLMPLIGLIVGGRNVSSLSFTVNDATIAYGLFIQSIIDFLIIALCVFVFVKVITKITSFKQSSNQPKPEEVTLLTEIRDLLKNK